MFITHVFKFSVVAFIKSLELGTIFHICIRKRSHIHMRYQYVTDIAVIATYIVEIHIMGLHVMTIDCMTLQ